MSNYLRYFFYPTSFLSSQAHYTLACLTLMLKQPGIQENERCEKRLNYIKVSPTMTKMKYVCGATKTEEESNSNSQSHAPRLDRSLEGQLVSFLLGGKTTCLGTTLGYAVTQQMQKMRTGTWPGHCHLEGQLRKVN